MPRGIKRPNYQPQSRRCQAAGAQCRNGRRPRFPPQKDLGGISACRFGSKEHHVYFLLSCVFGVSLDVNHSCFAVLIMVCFSQFSLFLYFSASHGQRNGSFCCLEREIFMTNSCK